MSKVPVFDIGDTLIPVTENINEAVNGELEKIGIENPPYYPIDQFDIYNVSEIQAWLDKHSIEADPQKIQKAYIEWKEDYFDRSKIMVDLQEISEKYGPIGIITDNPLKAKKCYREIFEEHGVNIRGFIASGEVGVKKPDPEIFEAFIERRDASAEEMVYFGNDLRKDKGAQKVGMKFVLVKEHRVYGEAEVENIIENLNYSTVRENL